MPSTTPVRIAIPLASGAMRTRISPGATNGSAPVSPVAPTMHSGLPSPVSSSKLCATAGAIAIDRLARSHAPTEPSASAPLAEIRRASALRAIRLSTARAAARDWSSLRPSSALSARRIPVWPIHASAMPIGSRTAVRIRRSLAPVGRCAKRSPNRHFAAWVRGGRLAELADEIEKIVRHRFTKRIVIDRAKGATEIARALLAHASFTSRGFLRAAGISGPLRLASLLGTQLLVPPARVFARS